MAEGTTTKGMKNKQASNAKSQSHMQRRAAGRGEQFHDANAFVTRDQVWQACGVGRRGGAIVGGAAATAGAIATAPSRAFNNSYNL
jgi:hypothetical protein